MYKGLYCVYRVYIYIYIWVMGLIWFMYIRLMYIQFTYRVNEVHGVYNIRL